MRGSVVVVRGCGVEMGRGKEAGVFELGGCRGVFWNITLRGVGRGGNVCGRLFGGEGRMGQTMSEREGGGRGRAGWGRGGGRAEGGERGGQGEGGGRRGGEGRGEGREEESEGGGSVLVSESDFSSFCVSSAPFLAPPLTPLVSLTQLTFFNISTNLPKTRRLAEELGQTSFLMSGCTFSSVWDVYDGGIVPSLNSPSSSLAASNTSFVGCYRSQNVVVSGSEGNPSKPGRQQIADNGANSFTWCVWNGSNTTGTSNSVTDGISSGGAINMYNLGSGTLSAKFCSFNDCYAHYAGGGIMCRSINSIKIENNSFNACTAQKDEGGGMYALSISTCVRISGCEFQKCKANYYGGGLFLQSFNVSGSSCIGTENGKGESACVFECSFASCTLTNYNGGGMYCATVPAAFKMRSLQFISCSAVSYGGGFWFNPNQQTAPSNNLYCYFFFFHDCRCSSSTPYGHDVMYYDYYNLFSSNNPFCESYTTNSNDKRVCYYYNGYQHTEKKEWLKEGMKDRYVGVSGNDANNLCGMSEATPCKTVGHAVSSSMAQLSSTITVLSGRHVSEGATINVGEKKISVLGKGKTVSVIGTSALSTSSTTLFSISSGQLEVGHVGIDHNATRSPSPSVFVVSLGSGTLSLEDVVISGTTGGSVISASVLDVALNQLKMIDIEIKNIKMSQPLFAEPSSAGSSSGESLLGNVTIRNVNRTTGDGVVMAKSVKGGETFVVWNTTIEGCECVNGNGGGIKVELASSSSQVRIGSSASHSGGTTKFNKTKCSGYGGGVMLWLADSSFGFEISSVSFVGCSATLGGKDVFVNGSRLVSGTITSSKLDFSRNVSVYDELMGYDRNEGGMGIFPLNVFFDTFSGAAHVGNKVNGYGGYDSWFCGFGYFPCKTIAFASQNRFSSSKKNIVLDSGFELGEVVSMAGSYEWEVYCGINKTNVNVRVPSGMTSSCLINVQSASSIKNIAFQIPFLLSSATSLIVLTSSSLTLTDCSVAHISESTSSVAFGYSIVNAQGGSLKMERFVIGGALVFGAHSAIEFSEGMTSVICSGCNISGIKRNEGDGGWMKGTVGSSGTLTVEGCNVNGCSCGGGKGGGIYVGLKGSGKVVVSGTSVIDGNKAENNGGNGGRGGGMFVLMESGGCGLTIGQDVKFSKVNGNVATYGKDVFVRCGSGVFLDSKVNAQSFAFFDASTIPSDVLKLSGCENGEENGVIPLFVYLCTMGSKVLVDGSGGNGKDHSHCGFDGFRCLTVDYCANSRMSSTVNEIEIVSSSSIAKEITGPSSFGVIISGRIALSDGERMGVNVSDGGSATQDWLVGCSSSVTMSRLSFVVKGQLKSRRSAFIHSTSTLSMTNCSVSFESGALTNGKIGYSIIGMAGGNLIVDGFVMESSLKTNGKSPITMTSGVQLELKNSRVSGVEVEVAGGNGGGGCLNVGMGDNGNVKIEESNFSSRCTGGSGMKGGGMMISVGSGGTLRVKGVKLSGCEVPSEDIENGGRGIGGGMFAEFVNQMGTFSLESMTFSGCNAWKGKNLFVEASDLSAAINSTSIGFNPEIGINVADLNELCGRERDKAELIVPLVVFLRTFSSPAYVSGRELGSEFRLCGYEDFPCIGIGNVGEVQFPSSKRVIRLTSTFSFVEEVKLDEQSYEIDSSNKDVGLKVGGTGTKTQEALVMNSVSSTLTGILFELGESIWEHTSFVHSSGGTLRFADCGIKMGNGVDAVNYEFASASGGNVEIIRMSCGGSERKVKFGMKAFIVINGNGGASIEDSLLESVETTNMKGLIDYSSSSSSLTIVNVTAQECVMGGKGLIWDDNGKKLGMRNCTIMKMSSLEGNGSVVSGEVGNGCAVEVNDVVIEGCGTLKGCGGGMSVILRGTGEMRLGKSGVVTSFEKCSAGGEGSIGGYGGGVLLRCEEGGSDFVMSGLTFGRGEGANTAAHGGNNMFVEGTYLYQLVNNVSFDFSFETEGDGFNIKDLMGAEDGNELKLIPVVVFFREKPSVGYVNGGNGGMDYHKCGYADFACSTLTYAGTSVFDTSPATLKLVDGSFIFDEMTLNTQEMNIDGDIEKAKIGISEGGEEGNEFLIKSEQTISFSSLALSISTFAESRKEYVFLCSSSTLRFEGCSFGAESESIGVGLICGKGGKVELANCEFENIRMTKLGMVTFDGAGVGGLIDEVIVRNVTREYEGRSLFELRTGGDIEIKNTTMNESHFDDGNEIEIGEGINAKIWNCTFKSIQRVNGNGGVLNGRVGSGKCVDINKCVFEECGCESMSAIGGGVVLIVGDGGKLLFDDNKMNGCTVSERTGKGGGLHLTFETTNAEYSMKNDTFTNNVAEKGEDVYLVCGSPWTMLLPALWEGTATRVTAENKMWVLESSEARKEDSLINYLFPRLGTDLFVSNTGNGLSSCGAKENPCSSVDIGFDRLNDEIERIMLVGAASVSKTINRGGKGLTIKGNEVTKKLVVEEGGKFELIEGDGQTHLTLSLLQISLPCSSSASASGDESIVEVRIGECFILDCLFSKGGGNSNVNECGKWIVIGNGGVIRIERTEMNGITFEGCGIARFGGGNVIFENCSLDGIETSGEGVIVGNGGSEVTLRNMTALGCVVGAGSLITSNGGSSLMVDGESRFENIETESVSGGCLKSEMKLNDLLEIGPSSILKCSANGNGGRGGGIYLDLSDDCVNNFSLSTLTFEGNVATEGRDLFISCKKLNETVTKERFGFEYKYENGEGEWMAVDMKGIDRDYFAESVDLGLFLVEMKGMEVCVSKDGYDTLGCGSDGYPCESMWSGISHIDRSGTEGERKVKVRDEGTIEDIYSFTDALAIDGCVNEGDDDKHRTIHFEGTINGDSASSSSVISSTVSLSLFSLKLQIPSQFVPSMNSLISSSGVLKLESCLFSIQSSTTIQYSLISTISGSCILKGCSLTDFSFSISPLVMASSVLFENSNFSNIRNTGSGEEGGVAKVILQGNEKLEIKSTNASSCSLSSGNGKGGFLYLDCQNCLNEKPFVFDADVTFKNNNAAIGKNAFIFASDLNKTVTNDSFHFNYLPMINDSNLFVGSDNFHSNNDLFMFLIPYSSTEIFISSEGFDVARCGSEEEPCFTMWKGMENMKKEIGKKTIQIKGSTIIRDSFNVSNYQIKRV
ncbi:uncharacterized protein MONOS_8047 [Monocercomonoides exilis]|uniref:uncharacterized protein n=1 Tax=Monocercomonoides exilis TaxID=2049356 RepID=UPI003559A566|nr:hypothetical protein MONOS_8047 [Monocercomonoides exilis]